MMRIISRGIDLALWGLAKVICAMLYGVAMPFAVAVIMGALTNGWRRNEDGWLERPIKAYTDYGCNKSKRGNAYLAWGKIYCRDWWHAFMIDIGRSA